MAQSRRKRQSRSYIGGSEVPDRGRFWLQEKDRAGERPKRVRRSSASSLITRERCVGLGSSFPEQKLSEARSSHFESDDSAGPFREIARQQWNFSPRGSTSEVEDYQWRRRWRRLSAYVPLMLGFAVIVVIVCSQPCPTCALCTSVEGIVFAWIRVRMAL